MRVTAGSFPVVRLAVLGTGTMGAPMARHLVGAGHEVRVWNRTREKAEGLGAEVVGTPVDAVAEVEVAITMLADGPAVDAVLKDALPAWAEAIWLQMSTVGVEWADRFAALAAEREIRLVDAPVMGSRPAAEDGQLLPLASGPPEARESCTEVFEAFSRGVIWLGDEPGLGSRLKLVTNVWIMNLVENLAETFAFAEGLGLDPRRFLEVIEGAPFDTPYAHWKGEMMLKGEFPAAFALKLARKDVGLALEAAEAAGVELPAARVTYERFSAAVELGHGDEDFAAAYLAALASEG
jgi:3-hydroxyisobutyrate dehydrogenase